MTDFLKRISIGDHIDTPRFGRVKITDHFEEEEDARREDFCEPTHFDHPYYQILGRGLGDNHFDFALIGAHRV